MASRKEDTLLGNWKCMLACILVSFSPFQYGIDFGLIGGLQAMIGFLRIYGYEAPQTPLGWNLSAERQQLIGSLMTLGAMVASAMAGPMAWKLGRKTCLWIACLLCCVADIIMMTTTSIGALYVARLLIGIANGFLMTFSQLYLQECTPAQFRGLALAAFQFWTSIGTLIGTIVDNFTAKIDGKESYLIPLGLIYIVPFVISIGLFFIPESPRWLAEQGKMEHARKSLLWLRPNPDSVDGELASIQAAIDEDNQNKGKAVFIEMWTNPVDRRRTILAVAAVSTQAASGAMFMIAYGTYFFEMAGVGNAFENSCILVAVGVIAIIINSLIITKYGRRRVFLITGLCLCAVFQLIIAAAYTAAPTSPSSNKLLVAMSVLYILSYNGMISSYAWVSGGELPSQRMRSYTFGLAAAVGFLGAWLATFTAPYFINPDSLGWGPKYGYIWVPSCLIAAVWIYFYLPEVKGRTLEEIDEMFNARLPARKFRTYVCTGVAALESKSRAAARESIDKSEKDEGGVQTIETVYGDEKGVANVAETAVHIA